MSLTMKYVTLDGHRLAYREAGSGPVILFLHGLGGNSASWTPQFDAFADRYRLVAWDMPGFGNSDLLPLVTTRDFSILAARFLDALGIASAIGVGTSFGTVILADLARTNLHRITAMVFACGVTGLGHLDSAKRAALRNTRRADLDTLGQRKFAEERNSTYVGKGAPAALVARVVDLAGSATTEGYMQAYGAMTESKIMPMLASIDVPALVISGGDDPIAPAKDCERVASALPRAEYHCVEHAGHYVNLEQTEFFNRLVGGFLARAEGA
jgi:pimeloyl-ACP methyl ester carboxylesterase